MGAALVSHTNGFQRSFRFPSMKLDYAGEPHSWKNASSFLMWRQTLTGPTNIVTLPFGTAFELRGPSRSSQRMTKCSALSRSTHTNREFQPKRIWPSFKAQDISLELQLSANDHRNLSELLWKE